MNLENAKNMFSSSCLPSNTISEEAFKSAQEDAREFKGLSNEERVVFYQLYKQKIVGDCNTEQPWAINITERMKWEHWNNLKGLPQDEAKAVYVYIVSEVKAGNQFPKYKSS